MPTNRSSYQSLCSDYLPRLTVDITNQVLSLLSHRMNLALNTPPAFYLQVIDQWAEFCNPYFILLLGDGEYG